MGPGRHGEVTTAANRIPAGHMLDVPPWTALCCLPWKPCVEMSTTLVLQMRTWGRLGGFPVALSEEAGGGEGRGSGSSSTGFSLCPPPHGAHS